MLEEEEEEKEEEEEEEEGFICLGQPTRLINRGKCLMSANKMEDDKGWFFGLRS